jgi:hypothetical protein
VGVLSVNPEALLPAGAGGGVREAGAVENTFMQQVVELHDKYMEVGLRFKDKPKDP